MGAAAGIAAPMAVSLISSYMQSRGGGGGGKKGREQAPTPQILPGLLPMLRQGGQLFGGLQNAALQGLGPGIGALTQAAQGAALPGVMLQIENELLPALERQFGRGEAAIRESAANAGVLRSSGTVGQAADLREGLESNMLAQLAGIRGQLANTDLLGRVEAGRALAGLPGQALAAGGGFAGGLQYNQPVFGPSGKEQKGQVIGPIAGGLAANPGLFGGGG